MASLIRVWSSNNLKSKNWWDQRMICCRKYMFVVGTRDILFFCLGILSY